MSHRERLFVHAVCTVLHLLEFFEKGNSHQPIEHVSLPQPSQHMNWVNHTLLVNLQSTIKQPVNS